MSKRVPDVAALSSFMVLMQAELADVLSLCTDTKVSYAVARQKDRCAKRALIPNPDLRSRAVANFKVINDSVRYLPGDTLELDQEVVSNARHFITVVLENYTSSISEDSIQETLDMDCLFDLWRFGPGSSNGIKGTHAVDKIVQSMTVTQKCKPFVARLRKLNYYFSAYDSTSKVGGLRLIEGSRLHTVQKNQETDRTIAIEPSGNMAMQLAAGAYLEGALRSIGLDISCQQDYNNLLALSGSMTNRLATIDLKNASDMISLPLVRALMPDPWYRLLTSIRSEYIRIDKDWVKLNMISTMGNGFTFPLMTLLFVSLIYGMRASKCEGKVLHVDWSCTSVFGDDIIVSVTEAEDLIKILEQAGLVVNTDKSYLDGPFRESCGGDYYDGYDVTPFYVKSLRTVADCYVAINQLSGWCARHKVWLHRSLVFLLDLIRSTGAKPFLVPEWLGDPQGIRTAQCPRDYRYLKLRDNSREVGNNPFLMMLAIYGYVFTSGTDVRYTPRAKITRWDVCKSILPDGHLDGWAPETRSNLESTLVGSFLNLHL